MTTTQNEKIAVCSRVEQNLCQSGIFNQSSASSTEGSRWRTSPDPFWLTSEEWAFLNQLGPCLLSFYKALNQLYFKSIRGIQPKWCAAYLDQGKPEALIAYGRINRFKQHLPLVIRPDLIPTESGFMAMELDSVPGGMGITACLSKAYENHSFSIVGGGSGMLKGFAEVFHSLGQKGASTLAIVISEESKDYRPEMKWMGDQLESFGLKSYVVEPKDVQFSEEGLWIDQGSGPISIDFCYRFFELFDLMNVSKSELILYSAKKGKVFLTPPIKAFLEEKLAFALLHHPQLTTFWEQEMGEEAFYMIKTLLPKTWVLDPRELPPYGMIPDLTLGDRPVHHWLELSQGTQQERQFVIKPSGFSPLAWGSRGIFVGHDLSSRDWEARLKNALSQFNQTPWILQKFHKGKRYTMEYYDSSSKKLVQMEGRVRLCPYYYVIEDEAILSGVLATLCPIDKKLVHGMQDAIMAPCSVRSSP